MEPGGQGRTVAPMGAAVVQMGALRAVPLAVMEEERARQAQAAQQQPQIVGLAAHIRTCWQAARDAKRQYIEPRMLQSARARRAEYDPDKLTEIKTLGGSELYIGLTGAKCRTAAGWLRDVILTTGTERPWTLRPTPVPDLPVDANEAILERAIPIIRQAAMAGVAPAPGQIREMLSVMRDDVMAQYRVKARQQADRMADKMEDQLLEGGFIAALDAFIDDLVTYPAAIIKGPVLRSEPALAWQPDGKGGFAPVLKSAIRLVWERVDPFNIYPSPTATTVEDGYLIEKHRLRRGDLVMMKGVEGYDDASIGQVLETYGRGGLTDWTINDLEIREAVTGTGAGQVENPEGLIDALQFWGSVQGQMLREWGLDEAAVPDANAEYSVEAWLVGSYVIKAVVAIDPLGRKPYFKASYEEVPGSWWGNSVPDLVRDPQNMTNAAGRAMVNNMGIASGPQVVINTDRLASGEDITTLTPWRIWQVVSDPFANGAVPPVSFVQPDSRVAEIIGVFERFFNMADEFSGIPRYLAGGATGGAGRTASGLSMLINNAGKSLKQVIANIDNGVLQPLLERLYAHNMRFADDPDLKGDVNIVARGAASLIAKEALQLRRNEFLAATANPVDMQIIGIQGRTELLREQAKTLDMDTDKVVPPSDVVQQRLMAAQAEMAGPQGTPANPTINRQTLMNGAPTTDNFAPAKNP